MFVVKSYHEIIIPQNYIHLTHTHSKQNILRDQILRSYHKVMLAVWILKQSRDRRSRDDSTALHTGGRSRPPHEQNRPTFISKSVPVSQAEALYPFSWPLKRNFRWKQLLFTIYYWYRCIEYHISSKTVSNSPGAANVYNLPNLVFADETADCHVQNKGHCRLVFPRYSTWHLLNIFLRSQCFLSFISFFFFYNQAQLCSNVPKLCSPRIL